ncbi:MAG: hypothetical protein OER04_15820 [Cyclobacteriaceae bacterium]|nr:hypothetical protein [Cyclobacteriaceae bacterium]
MKLSVYALLLFLFTLMYCNTPRVSDEISSKEESIKVVDFETGTMP